MHGDRSTRTGLTEAIKPKLRLLQFVVDSMLYNKLYKSGTSRKPTADAQHFGVSRSYTTNFVVGYN